jgi:hypothetical protein
LSGFGVHWQKTNQENSHSKRSRRLPAGHGDSWAEDWPGFTSFFSSMVKIV